MINLKALIAGALLFVSARTNASTFTCPVPTNFQNLSCEGSIEVKSLADLIAYKNNLAQKKGRAKNLIIDFDVNTNALTISTPCKITIAERRALTINGELCLHAGLGLNFSESSNLHANNVRLESNKNVIFENHADIKTDNLEMVSLGNTEDSRAHIRESAKVDAKNLLLEAFDRVSLGPNSNYKITESLKLYSRGDDDASINTNTQITASTFELMAYEQARLANNVSIKADTAIINGKTCSIINKNTVITATNKLGNCLLQSNVKNNFFTADQNKGFAPLKVNFDSSKIKSTSFVWSFGDGGVLTTPNAQTSYTYNRPGNFTATLKYLEGKNYKSAGGIQITVVEKPIVIPTANLICSTNNLLVSCSGLASFDPQGQPLTFTFNYADGFSETNLTGLSGHAYSLPGLYTVTMTISNLAGLTAQATYQVQPMLPPNVLPTLVLNCTSTKPNSLDCDSIGSVDTDGTIVSLQYSYDDAISETKADTRKVTHSFLSGGSHVVTLTAVDNDGGVSTLTKSFSVLQNSNPIADFTCTSNKPYQVSCQSTTTDVDVSAGVDVFTEYDWGLQNKIIATTTSSTLDYNFQSGGDFVISLSVKDSYGGIGIVSKTITVKDNAPPLANFVCTNTSVRAIHCASTATDSDGVVASTAWVLDDGTNFSGLSFDHTFLNDQAHAVTLLVSDDLGASSSSIQTIQPIKNQAPVASFACINTGVRKIHCASSSSDADGRIANTVWTLDDGTSLPGISFDHTYIDDLSHSVTILVTDNLGASTSAVQTIQPTKNQAPLANFACTNTGVRTIHCISSSSDVDGVIATTAWTIDDGTNLTGLNFDHTYLDDQVHTVNLQVTDNLGASTSTIQTVQPIKNQPPVANFACTNTGVRAIHCDSSSTDSDGAIAATSWSLDDGTNLTGISFDHTFLDDQTHAVNLLVTDNLGASTAATKNIQPIQNQPPQGDIGASTLSGVASLAVNFIAKNVLDSDGTVASIAWSFSDGGTASGATASHTFNNVGTFTASMSLTDNLGAVTTKSVTITSLEPLKAPPQAYFKYFENGSTQIDLRSTLTKTQFDLDHAFYTIDGSTQVPVAESYPGTRTLVDLKTYGTHSIVLTVVDIRGQTTKMTSQINLVQDPTVLKPVVDFSATQSSVRTAFFDFNHSFNPDVLFGIKNYHIDYGDGTNADITDDTFATHTYLNSGTYIAVLTVTTGQGTKGSLSKTLTVTNLDIPIVSPVASFGYQINSWAQNVSFYNEKSGTPNGSIISYLWDFGDGTTGTGDRLAHFYQPGNYFITLTVTDSAGLRSSQTQHVTIYQTGSDLVVNIDCGTATTQIQNCNITALDKLNEINSVQVLWGDGTSDMLTTPVIPGQGLYKISKKYFLSGILSIGLYVSTTRGDVATATITKQIILLAPIAKINCTTDGLKLFCNSGGSTDPSGAGIESYTFDYGNGVTETNTQGYIAYVYPSTGTYNVTMAVKSNSGLISSVTKQVTSVNAAPVAFISCSTSNLFVSCNSIASYDPQGSPISFEFDYADSFTEVNATGVSSHAYTQSGLYNVTVMVTSLTGLSSQASFQVQPLLPVNQPPIAYGFCSSYGAQSLSCFSNSFDPDNSGPFLTEWAVEDKTSTGDFFTTTLSSAGIKTVTLKVTDFFGAVATKEFPVTVLENQAPIANADCSLADSKNLLCKSNSSDPDGTISKTKWTLGNGKVFIGTSFALALGSETSLDIQLEVTDNLGKTSTFKKTIDLIANPPAPINPIADKCPVADHLRDKVCSDEFFTANSGLDLQDYLANGKFKDGKLLNLIIGSSISDNGISIATSCQLKIASNTFLQASNLGICLRGSAISLGSQAILSANNKGPINIIANDKIILDKSSLKTDGDVSLLTLNFLPFDGQVGLTNESSIEADSIKIDTKSSIAEDKSSSFISSALILNGGNCEISDSDFIGTCLSNPIPDDLVINLEADSLDKQLVKFNINSISQSADQVKWRFNNGVEEIADNNLLSKKFPFPGTFLSEVVIIDTQGFFRKTSQIISVSPTKFNQGQIAVFKFFGFKEAPNEIRATINNEEVVLTKAINTSETYLTEIKSNIEGSGDIIIPTFDYRADFNVKTLPDFEDSDGYISKRLDDEILAINSLISSNLNSATLNNSLLTKINELKLQIAALSVSDRMNLAKFLLANTSEDSNLFVINKNNKKFNLLDLIFPQAFALNLQFWNDIPEPFKSYLAQNIGLAIGAVSGTFSGIAYVLGRSATVMNPCKWCLPVSGVLAVVAAVALIRSAHTAQLPLDEAYLPDTNSLFGKVLGSSVSGKVTSFQFRGQFVPVDSIANNSQLVSETKKSKDSINEYLKDANKDIDLLNAFTFGMSPLEPIPLLQFPQNSFTGFLNPNLVTSAKVIVPNDGSVSVTSFIADQGNLNVVFKSTVQSHII